eukprot:scaffold47723_cov80-Phaeocystis_antarctica.AAC.5
MGVCHLARTLEKTSAASAARKSAPAVLCWGGVCDRAAATTAVAASAQVRIVRLFLAHVSWKTLLPLAPFEPPPGWQVRTCTAVVPAAARRTAWATFDLGSINAGATQLEFSTRRLRRQASLRSPWTVS